MTSQRGFPVVLAAPSGTGKTTIARALVQGDPGYVFSVSVTTREARIGERDGIDYERLRAHGFLVLEWRPARRLSLLAEANGSSRLVTNVLGYKPFQLHLRIGAKLDLGPRTRLEAGFVEGLSVQNTTDFGVQSAVRVVF